MHTTKQMEDLQISYTSALCAAVDISYDTQRHDDDSTDAIIKKTIFLSNGCSFFSQLRIQLKSTCSPSQYKDTGDCIKYTLKVKNYNDLCTPSTMPIILCLLILPEDDSVWVNWSTEDLLIKGSMYWLDLSSAERSPNAEAVSVSIPKSNTVSPETLLNLLTKIAKEEWP